MELVFGLHTLFYACKRGQVFVQVELSGFDGYQHHRCDAYI